MLLLYAHWRCYCYTLRQHARLEKALRAIGRALKVWNQTKLLTDSTKLIENIELVFIEHVPRSHTSALRLEVDLQKVLEEHVIFRWTCIRRWTNCPPFTPPRMEAGEARCPRFKCL